RVHEHWHVDVSYLNIAGTFFYLCSLLDGCSRFIVHWEIRTSMTEPEVETTIQRARERYPGARPRIISDNGPQGGGRCPQGRTRRFYRTPRGAPAPGTSPARSENRRPPRPCTLQPRAAPSAGVSSPRRCGPTGRRRMAARYHGS